jgi:alpha-mannosidase
MGKKLDTSYKTIHFVNHSHIDFTWWNPPDECRRRNEEIINSVIDLCASNPDFKFSYEFTAGLMNYFETHPEKKDDVRALLEAGRLDVGGLFVSPHCDGLTAEAVARNFYFGTRWLEQELGYSPAICKEDDVPGHTLQMPQLIKSAGMDTLIITSGPRGGFYWAAPDGSEVLTLCIPYNWSYWRRLGVDFEETEKNLPAEIKRAAEDYPGAELVIPDGDDMTLPNELLLEIVEHWNAAYDRPKLALSTMPEAIARMRVKKSNRRSGDMPNLWVVMNLLQVETGQAVRKIQDLLPIAEALCALRCVEKNSYKTYPAREIDSCWMRSLLVADHNWGCKGEGRGGPAGDEHKEEIAQNALRDTRKLVEGSVEGLSYALAEEENPEALTVIVHNPVGWQRTDVVSVEVECSFPGLEAIEIVDDNNQLAPFEVDVVERHEEDNTIKRACADFLARDLPSLGYATYSVTPIMEKREVVEKSLAEGTAIENEFYRVEFADDGSHLKSLYDKELDLELAGKFDVSAGPFEFDFGTFELFGIGMRLSVPDESFFENPENEGTGESVDFTGDILRADKYPAEVKIEKSGDFSKTLVAEGDFAGSRRVQKVVLYEGLKRVDLHIEIDWDGHPDIVLYLEMPSALMNGQKHLDIPFAVHRDGNELTEFWIDEAMPIQFKTRGVQDWLCFEDGGRGLAVATRWPVVDFTLTPAVPLLWTNASSGFFFGDRYRQAGKHSYQFSLTSYEGTWHENNIHLWGKQWSKPTLTFFGDSAPVEKRRSYISVDSSNVVISTVKKAQDEEAVVVRLYEAAGAKTTAQLQTAFPIKQARATNIIETASSNLASKENTVKLSFRPYEIKTVKLYI